MSEQEKNQFIKELAKEVAIHYKQEGKRLAPGTYVRMAREMIEEMEEDFN